MPEVSYYALIVQLQEPYRYRRMRVQYLAVRVCITITVVLTLCYVYMKGRTGSRNFGYRPCEPPSVPED